MAVGFFRFHVMLFYEVLAITQPFLTLDNSSDDNYFFVVPTLKCGEINDIDEELLNTHKHVNECVEPSIVNRQQLRVNKDDYLHSVIWPWYRIDNSLR